MNDYGLTSFEGNLQFQSNLKAEWIHEDDHIPPVQANVVECDHKIGAVFGMEMASRAAISICGSTVSGYFQSKENFYFFQPVDGSSKHVLYRRLVGMSMLKSTLFSFIWCWYGIHFYCGYCYTIFV